MSQWSSTDERVIALPSGRLVRGRRLAAQQDLSPEPDFGVYLLAQPVSHVPWEHSWLEWPDSAPPVDPDGARAALVDAWRRATTERVEIACPDGLGRTGTALACLAILDGLPADAAITFVRDRYDTHAVEVPEQVAFVTDFADSVDTNDDSTLSRVTRVGAYAVCVRDGEILLSHQIARGPAQNKWTLPGGGVDFGEDPADAAARECREETGLTPTVDRPLGVHSSTIDDSDTRWHSVRILYEGRFEADERPEPTSPNNGEIDQVGWFPLDALPSPVTEWVSLACELTGDTAQP